MKLDGTPMPFSYEHVKADFLPEGVPEITYTDSQIRNPYRYTEKRTTPRPKLSESEWSGRYPSQRAGNTRNRDK